MSDIRKIYDNLKRLKTCMACNNYQERLDCTEATNYYDCIPYDYCEFYGEELKENHKRNCIHFEEIK